MCADHDLSTPYKVQFPQLLPLTMACARGAAGVAELRFLTPPTPKSEPSLAFPPQSCLDSDASYSCPLLYPWRLRRLGCCGVSLYSLIDTKRNAAAGETR